MALDLSFKELADVAARNGAVDGGPLLIPLSNIDEDPNQPRRVFGEEELAQLADSIRSVGVLQPVVVRPSEVSGRYIISMGARRCRAARLAGLDVVPIIIQDANGPDRYAQMIENIQRDDLAPVEIAAFVAARLAEGEKQAEIGRKLGKPKDWVSRFAAVSKMPVFLQAKLNTSSIRAVYELYQAWRVRPDLIERACADHESFTDAQARRIAREVQAPLPEAGQRKPLADLQAVSVVDGGDAKREIVPPIQNDCNDVVEDRSGTSQRRSSEAGVSILVRHIDRTGRLLIDKRAKKGTRFAAVLIFESDQTEELPVSELLIEEIARC